MKDCENTYNGNIRFLKDYKIIKDCNHKSEYK